MVRSTTVLIGWLALALCVRGGDKVDDNETGIVEATSLLGRTLYAFPDSDGSIAAAKASLAADPENAALRLKLARAQAAKRQYREAITTCKEGLAYAPTNVDFYLE